MYGTNIFGFQTLILTGTISKMRTRLRPHYILTTLFTSLEPFGFQTLTLTGTISKMRTRLRPHYILSLRIADILSYILVHLIECRIETEDSPLTKSCQASIKKQSTRLFH